MLGDPSSCPTLPPLSLPPTPGTSRVGAGGGETLPLTRTQDSPDCPLPTEQAGPEAGIRGPQPGGRPGETRGTSSSLETGAFRCNRTSPELCCPLATTPQPLRRQPERRSAQRPPRLSVQAAHGQSCHGAARGTGLDRARRGVQLPRLQVRGRRAPPEPCKPGQGQGRPRRVPRACTQQSQPGKRGRREEGLQPPP